MTMLRNKTSTLFKALLNISFFLVGLNQTGCKDSSAECSNTYALVRTNISDECSFLIISDSLTYEPSNISQFNFTASLGDSTQIQADFRISDQFFPECIGDYRVELFCLELL